MLSPSGRHIPPDRSFSPARSFTPGPCFSVSRRIRFQATKYVLLEGELYYRTIDGVLLRCLDKEEAKVLMGDVGDRLLPKVA